MLNFYLAPMSWSCQSTYMWCLNCSWKVYMLSKIQAIPLYTLAEFQASVEYQVSSDSLITHIALPKMKIIILISHKYTKIHLNIPKHNLLIVSYLVDGFQFMWFHNCLHMRFWGRLRRLDLHVHMPEEGHARLLDCQFWMILCLCGHSISPSTLYV